MADHDKPTVTSNYLDFVSEMHGRMDDLAAGLDPARTSATNVPNYSIRWSSVAKKWQYLDGSSWKDLTSEYAINIAGYAEKLKTPRTIQITGGGTSDAVPFDGSANVQISLNSLDLDNLTGLGSAAGVDVVQGAGNSEDDVMSQKATTDALNTKNTQGTGSSQTRTNSQNDSRFIQGGSVVQSTGSSTTNVMSQKAVTDAVNARVPTSRTISAGTGLSGGGDLSANRTISIANNYRPIGYGQTWQLMDSSRNANTTYTNTTGRPLAVIVSFEPRTGGDRLIINIGGYNFTAMYFGVNHSIGGGVMFIVPPNTTYSSNMKPNRWMELR